MNIDVAEAFPHQSSLFDEKENLVVRSDHCPRESCKQTEHFFPIPKAPARQLPNDE